MQGDIKEQKTLLRREYKQLRVNIPTDKKAELDRAICENILSLPTFSESDTVLLYSPVKNEIDLAYVAERAVSLGKRIAYPVCDTESITITFKYVSSPAELVLGSYSIPEPRPDAPIFLGSECALCIVPALAFDREGFRLGYGKGYYDRFLSSFNGISLGAVYNELLCDILPRGYYDRAVDIIVSERGSFLTNAL